MKKQFQSNTASCVFVNISILKREMTWCVAIRILIRFHVRGLTCGSITDTPAF